MYVMRTVDPIIKVRLINALKENIARQKSSSNAQKTLQQKNSIVAFAFRKVIHFCSSKWISMETGSILT